MFKELEKINARPEPTEYEFKVEKLFSDVAGSPFDPTTHEFAVVARKL